MADPPSSASEARQTGRAAPKRSRTRTGCITCKIRRVKCDETRPACNRCISTGRTCDGYPAAGVPSQLSTRRALATAVRQLQVVGPAARVLGKPLPVDDAACFDFFRLCTASMTASVFPGDKFWSVQMLQAAHAEPAIWKAAVALGAFHRRWEYSNYCLNPKVTRRPGPQRDNTDVVLFTNQALKHYAAALSLAKSINDPSMLVILSVALGATANLAGRWSESQVHIRAGQRILREMGTQLCPADLEGAAQALERLDTQAMSLSDATSPYEYTSSALEEFRRMFHGDLNPHEQTIPQNPESLLGPVDDLGQAALATFRFMRHFFIIADAVTTGTITTQEFERARIQMVEANAMCERQLTLLFDVEKSNLRFIDHRKANQTDQRVLILSLRLYQTTLELFLLAHGSPPESFPLPSWATDDQDVLSHIFTSSIPKEDTPTPDITAGTNLHRGSANPNKSQHSSLGLSPMTTPGSEYYTLPQIQPKAPVAPTSSNPTLLPSRSPSPFASTAPSPAPRPSQGPCPLPIHVQLSHQSHASYSTPPISTAKTQTSFVPQTLDRQVDPSPNQCANNGTQASEPYQSQHHESRNPSTESEDNAEVQIPTSETRWDALHAHFKLIVMLASEIARNTNSPLPFFMSLEPGLAMPLYLTIKRCRHPVTRRRALGLLRRLNRQEGVWNCALAARAAEEIVILEEEGLFSSFEGLGGYGNDNYMEDIGREFRRSDIDGESQGHDEQGKDQGQTRSRSGSRIQSQDRDKGIETLLLPLDIFEKGDVDNRTCEMSKILEQYKSKALERINNRGRTKDAPNLSGSDEEVDEDIVMGEWEDAGHSRHCFVEEEGESDDASQVLTFWDDGWPKIPEHKRVLIQYPIFKFEESQLELLMFIMGDMKDGEDQGKMARRVVVDLY